MIAYQRSVDKGRDSVAGVFVKRGGVQVGRAGGRYELNFVGFVFFFLRPSKSKNPPMPTDYWLDVLARIVNGVAHVIRRVYFPGDRGPTGRGGETRAGCSGLVVLTAFFPDHLWLIVVRSPLVRKLHSCLL